VLIPKVVQSGRRGSDACSRNQINALTNMRTDSRDNSIPIVATFNTVICRGANIQCARIALECLSSFGQQSHRASGRLRH